MSGGRASRERPGRVFRGGVLAAGALLLGACATSPPGSTSASSSATGRLREAYQPTVDRILEAARTDSRAYERLRFLCDRIGNRLGGSKALDRAIAWAADTMRGDGLDEVRTEPVLVPKWVRGEERIEMVLPRRQRLQCIGLGNSVGTATSGAGSGSSSDIEAEVVVARDWNGLEALGDRVKGRIVLFHHPMPPYDPERGTGYGEAVEYRVNGPSRAAAKGAVACLVRSATARSLATPHTGMLRYAEGAPRIPAAALSVEDSEMIVRLTEAGETVSVGMTLRCGFAEDAPSANVVGEIRGSERPNEIVVFGGHIDSWDVGQGAQDDGGPAVACMEALRLLKSLGLRPRRTVRVILFTNEENGLRGGKAYAAAHADEAPFHVAAIEADSGVFRPLGFTTPAAKPDAIPDERDRIGRIRARLREVVALLEGAGAGSLQDGGGGADIGPLEPLGVPQIGLMTEMSTYFDIHHTAADTFDKVDKSDLDRCAGVLAATVFVLADMDESLRD